MGTRLRIGRPSNTGLRYNSNGHILDYRIRTNFTVGLLYPQLAVANYSRFTSSARHYRIYMVVEESVDAEVYRANLGRCPRVSIG